MAKQYSGATILATLVLVLLAAYYQAEPWLVTFVDDGPYYARPFDGDAAGLQRDSFVDLRRFGKAVFRLESWSAGDAVSSVLVLKWPDGQVRWAVVPVKPDGELGSIDLQSARLTWTAGWRVSIKPANQEAGALYLTPFGGFRFFNHSW